MKRLLVMGVLGMRVWMQTYDHQVGSDAVIAVQAKHGDMPLRAKPVSAIVYRNGELQETMRTTMRMSGLRSLQVPVRGAGRYDVYVTVEEGSQAAGMPSSFLVPNQ